jgi:hypothetical protein
VIGSRTELATRWLRLVGSRKMGPMTVATWLAQGEGRFGRVCDRVG